MKYVFTFGLLISTLLLSAQQHTKNSDYPKVGVVLSGGGAKGLAHIGVLKVIDSLGIQVDYVAGTSMGAILGSLYASGYSGKQLDSIFKSVDFNAIVSDAVPRASKTLYERENSEKYAISFPIEKGKISLPSALSRGQNTYNLLSKLLLHVNHIKDFSKLPIPFFCVGTHLETGNALILEHGELELAVKASGALPTLYEPVIIDGQKIIDGGIENNYPVDELRAKGMDVIIGVDVQEGLAKQEDVNSVLQILNQISNYKVYENLDEKIKKTDLYIKPAVSNFSLVAFEKGNAIVVSGKEAALKQIKLLAKLKTDQRKRAFSKKIKVNGIDSLTITSLDIIGLNDYTRSYILGKLKLKLNEKICYSYFNQGLNNLVSTNNFSSLTYDLKKSNIGTGYNLELKVKETEKTAFLRLAGHHDNLYKSALLLNVTKKRLLFKSDVLSVDLIVGEQPRYNLNYFIDKGFNWSIGINSKFNQFEAPISTSNFFTLEEITEIGINSLDIKSIDYTNQLYVQTFLRKDFAVTLGGEHKWFKVNSKTLFSEENSGGAVLENTNFFSAFGSIKFDTFDNPFFPKKGVYFKADYNWYFSTISKVNDDDGREPFSILKGQIGYAFPIFNKLSAKIESEAGFNFNPDSSQSLSFSLGSYNQGFVTNYKSFLGYRFGSINNSSYIKSTFSLDFEPFEKHHLIMAANYANLDDTAFNKTQLFSSPRYSGYSLGYSLETLMGPLEFKYAWSPEVKESIWSFNLGFWF